MRFQHTHRPGFLFGLIDFFTAGLFFLFYMPLNGLQDELDEILGHRTQRYWVAYVWLEYLWPLADGAGGSYWPVLFNVKQD